MLTDPIADMLTRIRNAQMVKKTEVVLPYSKLKLAILEVLKESGWIGGVEVIEAVSGKGKKNKKDIFSSFTRIKVDIVYKENGQPKITKLNRISKPGHRIYVSHEEIPQVLNGWGMSVISTSKGLLSDKKARTEKVGGEIICEVY